MTAATAKKAKSTRDGDHPIGSIIAPMLAKYISQHGENAFIEKKVVGKTLVQAQMSTCPEHVYYRFLEPLNELLGINLDEIMIAKAIEVANVKLKAKPVSRKDFLNQLKAISQQGIAPRRWLEQKMSVYPETLRGWLSGKTRLSFQKMVLAIKALKAYEADGIAGTETNDLASMAPQVSESTEIPFVLPEGDQRKFVNSVVSMLGSLSNMIELGLKNNPEIMTVGDCDQINRMLGKIGLQVQQIQSQALNAPPQQNNQNMQAVVGLLIGNQKDRKEKK